MSTTISVLLSYCKPWAEALWETATHWLDWGDKPHPEWVCAWKHVLLGFVWVFTSAACSLSWRTIGSVNELLLGVCVCVCPRWVCVCSFLPAKWRFEVRSVLIWEPHQLGVRRCQLLGQILLRNRQSYRPADIRECARRHTPSGVQSCTEAALLPSILYMSQMRSIDSLFKRLQS